VNDLDFAADDWARMHPPFRIGWEWLRRRAGDDAADEFEVDPAATPPLPPTISFTEEDYVASILPEIQDQVRYVPEERGGRWMVWGGHKWVEDKTLAAQRIVRGQLRRLARSMFKKSKVKGTNVEMRKALTAAARKIQSDSGIKSITSLLRALVTCTIDQFDTDPWVLNTPGRLIDLRSARSITRTPASMLAKSTAVTPADSYDPERAPQWAAFLEHLTDGDEELAGFLQRYAGYCLTGDVGEKVFVFAWGAADTGKSTFLETLSMILADYAGDVAIDSLLDVGRGRVPDDIAQLPGKRLVTAAEPQAGASWNDEMIKAMTGRDTLTVRRLWHGNFQFKAQFKLLVGGNHEPKIGRMDDAMKRRLLIAPMNNPVPREDQIENFELVLVGNEGPQVLAWMIEGCAAWQRDGLAPPEAVRSTTEAYWAAEDALSQWIEDSCELGPGHEVSRSELFGSWSSWCNARGRKPGAEADLKKYLDSRAEDLGLEDKRIGSGKNRARGYAGIRVLMDLESI
jgi:putative DNA primase/helicase